MLSESFPRDAACRDVDPELFFPMTSREAPYAPLARPEDAAGARRVCRSCPVSSACLTAALEAGEAYGIRAGFTADERAALTRSAVA